jgi:hypothetical protein
MTFEEFEKADPRKLRELAMNNFDAAQYLVGELKTPYMLEAQFYMQELDRREGSRVALRDFRMEVCVIGLIGLEIVLAILGIWLAIKQGNNDDNLMKKQNVILTNLQTSTADTATAMKGLSDLTKAMSDNTSASARTLLSLRSTTQEMNKGVHDQIALFYDPSVLVTYNQTNNNIVFTNTGRSSVKLTKLEMDEQLRVIAGAPMLIVPGTSLTLDESDRYKKVSSELQKGSIREVNVEAHLESEAGKRFRLTGALWFIWVNDKLEVRTQTTAILPER